MKASLYFTILFLSIFQFSCNHSNSKNHPLPTNGKTEVVREGEENENHTLKTKWKAAMHQSAPNVNWRNFEAKYAIQKQKRSILNNSNLRGEQENIADGKLVGTWYERGSSNQAGSVFDVEFDPATNDLFLISAGGSIFKGKLDGSHWEVVNDKMKFDHGLLKFIPMNSGRRMVALSNKMPYFSDDDGKTWTASTGVEIKTPYALSFSPVVIENDGKTIIYLVSKPDYWDNLLLYKSIDNGETFSVIHTFESYDEKKVDLCKPHNTNSLYVLTAFSGKEISKLDIETDSLEFISNLPGISEEMGRISLSGTFVDDQLTLLTYSSSNTVYKSTDNGISWKKNGKIPDTPWDVGMYVSKYNANNRFSGSIECFKTTAIPTVWEKVNNWWEYYDDVDKYLHADIMAFHEYETSSGERFILISNHGGLNISYDGLKTVQNLSLKNLNVSQYYDVVTDYSNPNEEIIYAGAQDQGFQKGFSNTSNPKEPIEFEQTISGDYGHIVLTDDNSIVWKVYPGGSISATNNQGSQYDYNLESSNETVWIPPMTAVPNENAVYLAGGSSTGGLGSFIIKLKIKNLNSGEVEISDLPFNFIEFAGSEISAIAVSPFNPAVIYVSTNNSLFFYSNDRGQTFTQSEDPIPGSHYLYGSVILPSKIDSNVVYMAGSGYSNPPVFKSVDQGKTFTRMDNGMPATLVYDMAFNDDETLLFAGTESAPYVYVVADDQWYDMSGNNGPNQIYWSVEFIENQNKIRFGTYGRGIWDFQIQDIVSTTDISKTSIPLDIYPNPVENILNIKASTISGESHIQVVDLLGRVVFNETQNIQKHHKISINLNNLNAGRYILTIQNENHYFTGKFIKK